jgi:hypothetical protein
MHQMPDGHKPGPLAGPAEAGIGASNFLLRRAGSVERQAGIAMEEHIVAGLWRDGHGHGQGGAEARSAGVQQSETALLRPLQFHCCYRAASSKGPVDRWLLRRAQGPSVRCWINQKPQATGDNGSAAAEPWPWIEQGRTGGWNHRAAAAPRHHGESAACPLGWHGVRPRSPRNPSCVGAGHGSGPGWRWRPAPPWRWIGCARTPDTRPSRSPVGMISAVEQPPWAWCP